MKIHVEKLIKRISLVMLSLMMLVPTIIEVLPVIKASTEEYEIYPIPQSIEYYNNNYILSKNINVVYEEGIDTYTIDRLKETFALKNITITFSNKIDDSKTNVLIGIAGNTETFVDEYVSENGKLEDSELFTKGDSYYLESKDNVITVLGKNTDAAFYGLTTLYHILAQIDSFTIEEFKIEDYSDVASRGFIEGYYGNPWSTEDRANLMTWSGYYKLNTYFYAPKDDPKHNANWRELYTEQELIEDIMPLAEAGNASKCRFVYALHPYMYNAIDHSTEESYQRDLAIMQAKFDQVIAAGVRQIAILADDAANVGGSNYIRLLKDMEAWLEEKQETYPDLITTLPFCTQEYMYSGETYYSEFPSTVQIVMTGGKIWGEVSKEFTDTFYDKVGRGSYLWINWPCTDNSKNHLIMGGYSDFLHSDVDPEKIEGIVLNPMQQSEPSKVAIFGNAVYSWNIWDDEATADQAWYDSFKYVDHNSAIETSGSSALRELSKHMINQNMDSRVVALEESIELSPLLDAFKERMANSTLTNNDIEAMVEEFEILENAVEDYRNTTGNKDVLNQIEEFIDCYEDTVDAALLYLEAYKSYLNNDNSNMISLYNQAKQSLDASKKHGFAYLHLTQYAEVGVQHILPFINELDKILVAEVNTIVNPNTIIKTYISNRFANPTSGEVESVYDNDDSTYIQFTNPNYILEGDYVGLSFNNPINVDNLKIVQEGGKNHFYNINVEYTLNGEDWIVYNTEVISRPKGSTEPIIIENMNLKDVVGIRMVTTQDNGDDSWFQLYTFDVNTIKNETESNEIEIINVEFDTNMKNVGGNPSDTIDKNDTTEFWVTGTEVQDNMPKDGSIVFDLGEENNIGSIRIVQGKSKEGDILNEAIVEYYDAAKGEWIEFGPYTKAVEQVIKGDAVTSKIRIRNLEQQLVWWRLGEVSVYGPEIVDENSNLNLITNIENSALKTTRNENIVTLTGQNIELNSGDYVGLDLDKIESIESIISNIDTTLLSLQISKNNDLWTDCTIEEALASQSRYIRLINNTDTKVTMNISEFKVTIKHIEVFGTLVENTVVEVGGWGDSRNNGAAFDGDMTTQTKYGGNPSDGTYAIYTFGDSININSLRIYSTDSTSDYLRDAIIQLSSDGVEWTNAFNVGDGVTDVNRDDNMANTGVGNIDSLYPNVRYYGNDELDIDAKYMRIYFNTTYPNRAVIINEIVINNGEYISVETSNNFEGTKELAGHLPSYMIDEDFNTSYKGSEANGYITYTLDSQITANTIRFVQTGLESNAEVSINVVKDNKIENVKLGTLSQMVNDFVLPSNKIVSVTIAWGENIPEINEILFITQEIVDVDKTELEERVNTTPDNYDNWIENSKVEYQKAVANAKALLTNLYVSQSTVDSMLTILNRHIDEAKIKGDISSLQAQIDNMIINNNTYTSVTYDSYYNSVMKAKTALENSENLWQSEIDKLNSNIESNKNALVYSSLNREIAEQTIKSFETISEENKAKEEYIELKAIYDELNTLIANDKGVTDQASRVNPVLFNEKTLKYNELYEKVIEIIVADYSAVDTALVNVPGNLFIFTNDSVTNLQTRINEIVRGLTSENQAQVDAMAQNINDAIASLQEKAISTNISHDTVLKQPITSDFVIAIGNEGSSSVQVYINGSILTNDQYTSTYDESTKALVITVLKNTIENLTIGNVDIKIIGELNQYSSMLEIKTEDIPVEPEPTPTVSPETTKPTTPEETSKPSTVPTANPTVQPTAQPTTKPAPTVRPEITTTPTVTSEPEVTTTPEPTVSEDTTIVSPTPEVEDLVDEETPEVASSGFPTSLIFIFIGLIIVGGVTFVVIRRRSTN